jgi:6-phosphogluconolactonase
VIVCVSGGDSRRVTTVEVDESSLAPRVLAQYPVPGVAGPMAQSADGRRLFVVVRTEPWCVVTFAVNPQTGALCHLSTDLIGENTCYAAAGPGGYLLLASVHGKGLLVHRIKDDQSGVATPATQRIDLPGPHCVAFDSEARWAFVPCLAGDVIAALSYDPRLGALDANLHNPLVATTGSGPRHLRLHPGGNFAYLLHEYDAMLSTYSLDAATGTLTHVATVPTLVTNVPSTVRGADVQVHPSGRFLYTTERTTSTVSVFRTDGAAPLPTFAGQVSTETRPRGIGIDPSGRILLAAGEVSGAMSVYSIDHTDGGLRERARTELGGAPHWFEFLRP